MGKCTQAVVFPRCEISQNDVDRELYELKSTFERLYVVWYTFEDRLNIFITESFIGTFVGQVNGLC